jgi:hypothetical protein
MQQRVHLPEVWPKIDHQWFNHSTGAIEQWYRTKEDRQLTRQASHSDSLGQTQNKIEMRQAIKRMTTNCHRTAANQTEKWLVRRSNGIKAISVLHFLPLVISSCSS